MIFLLWFLAYNVQARYEDVQCCSEIYVSGGYEFQEKSKTLDMKARFQRDSAQLPDRGRFYHSHVIYRSELYLLGGFSRRGPTNTVFRLDDPVRVQWKKTFPMKNSRGFFDPVVFQDRIWACGGKNQSHFITSCESFSPETGWRDEPDIMESRFDHSTAVTSKGLYMIGGKTGTRLFDGEPFTKYTVEIFPSAPEGGARGGSFNPAWKPAVQLPEAIYGQSSTTLLDTVYVFGGLQVLSRSTRRSEVYALSPEASEWLLIGNMNMARSRAVVVNFGYQLFIIGGCDGGCAAELFTPAISRFQFMNSWVKADGSFSEAGEVWPWSCSVDLCYQIYSEQSIEILRGLGYTTLGTTASTLYETTAAELELYDIVTDSSDLPFFTTESSNLILYETTQSSLLIPYETTASEDLLYIATTQSSDLKLYETTPDISSLLEMVDYEVEENEEVGESFLDSLKDTKFTFTTSSPPSECTLSPILCDLIGATSGKSSTTATIPAVTVSSTTAFMLFKKPESSETPFENEEIEEEIILDTTEIYLETSTVTTVAPTVTISLDTSTQNSLKIRM